MQKRSIARNALLLTVVHLMLRAMSMLFYSHLSGTIGAAGLGLLQLVLSATSLALTAGLSGMRVSAVYLCAEEFGARRFFGAQQAMEACLVQGLVTSAMAAGGLYALSPWICRQFLRHGELAASLRISAAFLPVTCCHIILDSYFTAVGKLRLRSGMDITEQLICYPVTLLLLQGCQTAADACSAILLGSGLTNAASTLILALFIFQKQPQDAKPAPDLGNRLKKLWPPLALGDLLRSALVTAEQFLIPRGLSMGMSNESALAAYGTVTGMVFPILMFPSCLIFSLSELLIPALAEARAAGKAGRIRSLSDFCLRMGFAYACAAAGAILLLADFLMQRIYHSPDASLLRLFLPAVLLLYADAMTDGMLKGLGQQPASVRYNTLTSFLDVVLLLALLPGMGLAGYVFTFYATHILNFILSLRKLILVTGIRLRPGYAVRCLGCLTVSLLGAVCTPNGFPLLRAVFFLPLFFLTLSLTDTLSASDRLRLSPGKRGKRS